MRARIGCLLGVLIGLGALQAASAADMPTKASNVPPSFAAHNWSGCYIGGDIGWIGSRDRFDTYPSGLVAPFNPGPNNHSYSGSGSSAIGGVLVGCNWTATPNWVFGVEADISASGLKNNTGADYGLILQTTPPTPWTAHNETVSSELPWLATFRGRLGYAWDDTLLFATGGLAVGQVKASLNYFSFGNDFTNAGSTTTTRTGWTVGGGIEHALDSHWSVKAEYLYVDLGTLSFDSPNVVGAPGTAWGTSVKVRENIAKVGVNYKF